MSRSEWQAYMERERRRERRARIVYWTLMLLAAVAMAFAGYCALVGFLLILGGQS